MLDGNLRSRSVAWPFLAVIRATLTEPSVTHATLRLIIRKTTNASENASIGRGICLTQISATTVHLTQDNLNQIRPNARTPHATTKGRLDKKEEVNVPCVLLIS